MGMSMSEKALKRLERAKETLENFGRQEVVWKRRLADAVLALIQDGREVTVETLKDRLAVLGEKTISIEGTDMKIEMSQAASETAIAHLDKAIAVHEEQKTKQ